MNQKRIGILITYLNLVVGMFVNIFLTPRLIASLGDDDYSLYKVMQSFAGPLAMFHLGISTIVTRSVVQYKSGGACTEKDKQNTMALALLASFTMAIFVSVAGMLMCKGIPNIYGDTYSPDSIKLGQKIFTIFVISTVIHVLTDAFSGCVTGHEKFAVSSSIQFSRTALKMLLWLVFLKLDMGVIWFAYADLFISIITFATTVGYTVIFLHEIPRLYKLDVKKLVEILSFGFAILLQAIVNQVNNNVDTMILGAYVEETSIITMYTSALAIYAIYNSLISVMSNFFLPKATRLVTRNATGNELTDYVIETGRYQAIIAVACVFGFALFGKNFIKIWIGEKYLDAYWITLLLMIPVTIPLVENAMIAVLDAALKRMYRSVTLVIMAMLNVVLSVFLVRLLGFWGTAIGTAASLLIGHGLLMNAYYARTFKVQIGRMFVSIFKGILPAGALSAVVCFPLALFLPNDFLFFAIKCSCFIIVYLVLLFAFGLTKGEKVVLLSMLKKKRTRNT